MRRQIVRQGALALAVLIGLRLGIGPLLVVLQLVLGARSPGGNCGNAAIRLPNTDPVLWWLSDGAAQPYESACVRHDRCYNRLGVRKASCDAAFLRDLRGGCDETAASLAAPGVAAGAGRIACRLEAETYYVALLAPPFRIAYCYEQHYARTGSRDDLPPLDDVLRECRQSDTTR